VTTQKNWRSVVERIVKAQMSVRGVKYQQLSERLAHIGVTQSADNLRNKVNKGIMGADLLLQILMVLNARPMDMQELQEILTDLEDEHG